MGGRHERLSACVISYNRAAILGSCLRALDFADEVLVVDKTSTDGARNVAARFADRVVTVPWSPTVEETRALAVSLCRHDWVLLLDDDECLNPAAVRFIRDEMANPSGDVFAFPLRHYILGVHDEAAYYWPEHHVRLFRRGAVVFEETVHAGMRLRSDKVVNIPIEHGACIHHLSHPDVASWIERTNRYTSRPDRARVEHPGEDLIAFAHDRIDHWAARGASSSYADAVGLLRAVYDIVDRLKIWEESQGLHGHARFRALCRDLDALFGAEAPRRPGRAYPWRWFRRAVVGALFSPPACRRPRE